MIEDVEIVVPEANNDDAPACSQRIRPLVVGDIIHCFSTERPNIFPDMIIVSSKERPIVTYRRSILLCAILNISLKVMRTLRKALQDGRNVH